MTAVRLGCVVEGHGEVAAVPVLLRRMVFEIDPEIRIEVPEPIRIHRSSMVSKPGELERAVALAALKVRPRGAVMILVDSDDDCPAQLAPDLLARVQQPAMGLPVAVVLAKREFEAWFLAAAESIRGRRGLPENLERPHHPEEIRGAKDWLRKRIPGRAYSERIDQPALAAIFDLALARGAPSFDKCYRELERLIRLQKSDLEIQPPSGPD